MSLQELDQQQREHAERRRVAEQNHGPQSAQIVMAVLQSVNLEEQGDIPIASTPEELVNQAHTLLEAKGKMTKPVHGSFHVADPLEHDYLKLPPVSVQIGGREVKIFLQEPLITDPFNKNGITKYYLGVGLTIGGSYMQMSQTIHIDRDAVRISNLPAITSPQELQKVSGLLTMADRALPPK